MPIFMDNSLTTGSNNGTSWENAYRSFADMGNAHGAGLDNALYIKASSGGKIRYGKCG